jgi:hypothetical protein
MAQGLRVATGHFRLSLVWQFAAMWMAVLCFALIRNKLSVHISWYPTCEYDQ